MSPTTRTKTRPSVTPAKTAYELLQRVCEHIKEEPRRYYQGWWGFTGKRNIADRFGKADVPVCGTVACRAGWIVGLHDGLGSLRRRLAANEFSIPVRANDILGMHERETEGLYNGFAVNADRGTPQYVRDGVAGLRAFMKQHRVHLKARLLKGV